MVNRHVCALCNDRGLQSAYSYFMVTRIVPKTFKPNYLAKWRDKRGLTQDDLAAKLDTYKGQVSNWENSKRAMTFNVQAALAEALGIQPSDLFRDPDRPSVDELLQNQPPELQAEVYGYAIGKIEDAGKRRQESEGGQAAGNSGKPNNPRRQAAPFE